MSAQQQEATDPEVEASPDPFNPIVMHTIRTWQMIDDAILYGSAVIALCGETWTPKDSDLMGYETTVDCPLCETIIDTYRSNP